MNEYISKKEILWLDKYFKNLDKSKCKKCGQCCSKGSRASDYEILMSEFEKKKIKINYKVRKGSFKFNKIKFEKGRCIFLDEKNICKIYKYRPIFCSGYPHYMSLFNKKSICNNDIKFKEIEKKYIPLFKKYLFTVRRKFERKWTN